MNSSTAVAPHPGFASREEIQLRVAERREIAEMAKAFRATQWGKDLDEGVSKAMASWCKRYGIDATEVSVLGGSPYIEATYYLRRLAAMGPELLEYARADHVEHDPRLEEMSKIEIPEGLDDEQKKFLLEKRGWAMRESFRRRQERITHNLSDEAPAAVVYRVKRRGVEGEFTGADECGLGKKKRIKNRNGDGFYEKAADPVGDESPRKTAETRAARRCLRQVISTFPALDTELKSMEREARESIAAQIAHSLEASNQPRRAERAVVTAGEGTTQPLSEEQASQETIVDAEEVEEQLSPEEAMNQGPRTKAQIWNLEQAMAGPLFTDEERGAAADFAVSATYGEMTQRLSEVKLEEVQRARAAKAREDADAAA